MTMLHLSHRQRGSLSHLLQMLSAFGKTGRFCSLAALFLLFAANAIFSQNTGESAFAIDTVVLNHENQSVDLYIKAVQGDIGVEVKEGKHVFFETSPNGERNKLKPKEIIYKPVERRSNTRQSDTLHVLFLVSTGADGAAERRKVLQEAVQGIGMGASNFYIATYGNDAPRPKILDPTQLDTELDLYDAFTDTHAELYRGIVVATRFMREQRGKWVLFILTNGVNKHNTTQPSVLWPYDASDVQHFLSQLSLNAFVIPVGIGSQPDTTFLRQLARASGNPLDTCAIERLPPGLLDKIARKVEIKYNNIVRFYPWTKVFKYQEPVVYTGFWNGGPIELPDSIQYTFYAPDALQNRPDILGEEFTETSWLKRWVYGLVGVLLALGAMMYTVPWLDKRNFKLNHVKAYQPMPGRIQRDPITGDELQSGQLVVTKCPRQTTSLESWEYVGHKCPNYPKCLDNVNPCDGAGAPSGQEKFFSGKGVYRRLNWLWFGMVGGLIGWSLFALFNMVGFKWYNAFLLQFWGERFGSGERSGQALDAHIQTLTDETLLGAAFGAGLCFMLAWAEERSQPRKISWSRIALRTVFGLMASLLVFLFGFFLQYKGWVDNLFVSGLVTWLLFGLVVGAVLSMRSTITLRRGLTGGVIAALVGYIVYALGNTFVGYDFATVKLLSFIVLGGLLGLLLVTVVTRLEDFELEYVSPELFRQVNPISKWLKNGVDIFIGRESGNYVYVKWDDEAVKDFHARLFYDKGVVFIEPLAETLLNGKLLPLKANTPLRHNDMLQLGRDSITRMRYREKRRASDNGAAPSPASGGGFRINN